MEMIDLSRLEPQETLNHTSKGNQLKWKCYGYWYKADHMGYERLAETIVSALLDKSTVKYPFVLMSTRKSSTKTEFTVAVKALIFSRMAMILFRWKSCIENLPAGALQ